MIRDDELKEYIACRSVSTDPTQSAEMERCRAFLIKKLGALGFTTQVLQTKGHPAVYAERLVPGRKTVLIYGHYDVQPAVQQDGWDSDPFILTERNGNYYARGITDNKGPLLTILWALEQLPDLQLGIKFLIEGEEEIGSLHLPEIVTSQLQCDLVFVSDANCIDAVHPCIEYGLRGLMYMFLRINGPRVDIHSGQHGGPVPNPHLELARILAACKNTVTGEVLIPGFYDDVAPCTTKDQENFSKIPLDLATYKQSIGVSHLYASTKEKLFEQQWFLPTFECHGITGGFTGEGAKTIIPSYAEAKISTRLVPHQNPDKIFEHIQHFVHKLNPLANLRRLEALPAMSTSLDNRYVKTAVEVLEKEFQKPVLYLRSGGVTGVVHLQKLGAPILMVPAGLPDDGMHSPNEKFSIERMKLMETVFAKILQKLAGE